MVWLAYGAMCAIWGTTWLAVKDGLHYVPPLVGVGLRFLAAAFVMYAVGAVRGDVTSPFALPWKLIAILAALNFGLDYVLIYVAESHLDSGLVAVLFGTMPFFVFGFGYIMNGERISVRMMLGASFALAGVAVVSLGELRASPVYVAAAIGAAAASALGNVYAKRESHYSPFVVLPPAMLIGGVAVLTLGLSTEHVNVALAFAPRSVLIVAFLALFGSAIAFFCNFWALQRLPASVVGLSTLVIPVVAVAVGIVWGGEQLTTREAYGALAVALGIACAIWPQARRVAAGAATC